jgi:CheY-like chemotaxis protein
MTIIRYCDAGKINAIKSSATHVRRIPRQELIRFMGCHDIPPERLREFEQHRVFIVDDEPDQIEIVRRAIENMRGDFEIESCTSGYDAVIRIGAFQPDLVILDLLMPGLDGFEVCRAIRAVRETRDAKILIVTGHATPENIAAAEEAGADDWLAKPVGVGELRQKVMGLLRMGAAVDGP